MCLKQNTKDFSIVLCFVSNTKSFEKFYYVSFRPVFVLKPLKIRIFIVLTIIYKAVRTIKIRKFCTFILLTDITIIVRRIYLRNFTVFRIFIPLTIIVILVKGFFLRNFIPKFQNVLTLQVSRYVRLILTRALVR